MANSIGVVVQQHQDTFVAYATGIAGVVVGEGETAEAALADLVSAIQFHLETFGTTGLDREGPQAVQGMLVRRGGPPCPPCRDCAHARWRAMAQKAPDPPLRPSTESPHFRFAPQHQLVPLLHHRRAPIRRRQFLRLPKPGLQIQPRRCRQLADRP
jgi:predicted RNase H-like HicB family nuclease